MPQPAFNPAYIVDPGLFADQQQVDQRQQIAQLLLQQGLTPMSGTESVGGVAGRRSPMEGVAKLAALLSGQSQQAQANQGAQALMERQAAAMGQMFGMGQPQQPQGESQGQALGAALAGQPQGSSTPAGMMGLPGMSPMQSYLSSQMYPKEYGEAYMKRYSPNDTSVSAMQGGVDPQMANRLALIKANTAPGVLESQQAGMDPAEIRAAALSKSIKDAEYDRKPGNLYVNGMTGERGIVPKIPENANPVGVPGRNGALPGVTPVPGSAGVMASNSAATAAGTNTQTPETGYVDGQPVNTTRAARVSTAVAPATQAARDAEAVKVFDLEIAAEKDPTARAALQRTRDRMAKTAAPSIAPEQAPGVVIGANDAQKQLGDRFGALRDQVATAQTTNSYLDNIKQLAEKAATGKFSDRQDYLNALLSSAGVSEKATDAKTANDLLNKYSNQIVSRLSTGGLGTDAARTILGSAYPNAHMTKEAIGEAVDNIKAVNDMQKAKLTLLSPHGNARDAAQYQQREAAFDKAADPRIWQLQSMNGEQAQKFLAAMPPAMQAELRQRVQTLKQLGAL